MGSDVYLHFLPSAAKVANLMISQLYVWRRMLFYELGIFEENLELQVQFFVPCSVSLFFPVFSDFSRQCIFFLLT